MNQRTTKVTDEFWVVGPETQLFPMFEISVEISIITPDGWTATAPESQRTYRTSTGYESFEREDGDFDVIAPNADGGHMGDRAKRRDSNGGDDG